MSWVFGTFAVTLGFVLVWGVIAPRSQWRALAAWSVADIYRDEPGGTAYGIRRVVNGIGALALVTVFAVTAWSSLAIDLQKAPPPTRIEQMWGKPDPQVVDRIVTPLTAPPTGLVEMPMLGYQDVDAAVPKYFDRLKDFSLLGNTDIPRYIGVLPDLGNRAVFYATIVVHVRGPLLCVPRAVTVIESETAVQIGVFYGLPAGTADETEAACAPDQSVTSSVLIPLELNAPLGDRVVQTLSGTEIGEVAVPLD